MIDRFRLLFLNPHDADDEGVEVEVEGLQFTCSGNGAVLVRDGDGNVIAELKPNGWGEWWIVGDRTATDIKVGMA